MYLIVILSLFLLLASGSKADDRQFYACKFDGSKVLQFSCEQPSSLFYSEKCNVVDTKRQNFKCDGEHTEKTFTFRQRDFFDVEELYIEGLGIENINVEGEAFRSESTGMLEGFLGFGLIKTVTIKTLSASGNELRSIPKSISMASLASLDLSNNKFAQITSDELMGAAEVKHLSFAHNQIRTLDTEVFKNLTELQYLDLSHNHIRSKNLQYFKNPANLEHLDLSHNSLEAITAETFVGDANIKLLNLSHNLIGDIDFGAFSTLEHLQHLDLSSNSLKSFDLSAMPELTHLHLEGNYLPTLEDVTPEKYPKLQVVSITRNFFNCDNLNEFMKQWKATAKLFKDGREITESFEKTDCHEGVVKFMTPAAEPEPEIDINHHEKPQMDIDLPSNDLNEENEVEVNFDDAGHDDIQEYQQHHHNLESMDNQKEVEEEVFHPKNARSNFASSAKLQNKDADKSSTM